MTEPKYVTLPTREKMQEAANAYALAVGRLSIAWNYLHGALGDLFALVIGGDAELVLAVWRSVRSDRTQREMLRAAIEAASLERWKQTPTAPADLLAVLKRADELSIVRNDAMHAPVMLHIGAEIVEVGVAVPPRGKREWKLFNRAGKGRKLLEEFAKCERDVDVLSRFVRRSTRAPAEPVDRQEWPTLPEQILVSPKAHKDPNAESEAAIKRGG
jgi:hypothetical protein